MKTLFLVSIMVALVAVQNARAEFGGVPGLGGGEKKQASGGGDPVKAMKEFLATAQNAEKLMTTTVDSLFSMVVSTKESAKIEAEIKEANAIKDPKERAAKLNEIKTAAIKEFTGSDEQKAKLSNLDDKKKKALVGALYNLQLAILKDKDLVEKGNDVVSAFGNNPMEAAKNADKVSSIKDALSSIGSQLEKASDIMPNLVDLAKANHVEPAMPKSSSDAPKKVSLPK